MTGDAPERLRVLIAAEEHDQLVAMTAVVRSHGHDVIGRATDPGDVGRIARDGQLDVAVVGVGVTAAHALELISRIAHAGTSPVVAVLGHPDGAFVDEAARRGIFACVTRDAELGSAIAISVRRFCELRNLEGAVGRRALIERAKGILMERHQISEDAAFDLLRDQARSTSRKLSDVALAVVEGHRLLPPFKGAASADTT